MLLVDTRPFTEYSNGRIQGAVNLDLFRFHWLDRSKTGIKQFENQSRILLSNLGVKKSQQVVFYDNLSGMSSARGVWLLLYFSHKNACLLDGGFRGWQIEGYPIETKTNHFSPSAFVEKPDCKILATIKEVEKSVRRKDSVIVDARTKEEFAGRHELFSV